MGKISAKRKPQSLTQFYHEGQMLVWSLGISDKWGLKLKALLPTVMTETQQVSSLQKNNPHQFNLLQTPDVPEIQSGTSL